MEYDNWKNDYLELESQIEEFIKKRIPDSDYGDQNVGRLLRYHLNRAKELLWAEVNGGLDEEYQAEIDGHLAEIEEYEEILTNFKKTRSGEAPV